MLDANGKERDKVQIVKDSKSPPVRIRNPRKPGKPEGPLKMRSRDQRPDPKGEDEDEDTTAGASAKS